MNMCFRATFWLKGVVGGNSPFLGLVEVANCWGVMASGGDGLTSPAVSSNDGLFGGPDLDFASDVPSPSLRESVAGNNSESLRVEPESSSNVNFGHVVGASWNSLDAETVEPVWNSGFWKCIFGNDNLGYNLTQQFKRPMPVQSVDDEGQGEPEKRAKPFPAVSVDAPLFQSCVKSTDDIAWQEKREGQLQRALKHWLIIIETWNTRVEFVMCLQGCESTNAQLIMLGDVFKGKAPSTLTKRANSMKLLCRMLDNSGLIFPCDEPALYNMLCELRQSGAPPSRGKGILEAIAFVRYTMGIVECDVLLKGRRCWGAATSDEPVQRKQSSPLTVKELEVLHNVLEHDADVWNRMFSGTVLFMVYARSRWSDGQHAVKVFFDKVEETSHFVEVLTGHHKTMRALQHRHQFLPLIAPAIGVTSQNWADLWERVRNELGIQYEQGHPLMLAPLANGQPGRRALDSQEAGQWLRALLSIDAGSVDRKVSSHSLKSTMLSYLAKRGIDMGDRLLLGYHTSPFTMGLTYSRDGMARPLQILSDMLSEIRCGKFQPDQTRSGRLLQSEPEGKGSQNSQELGAVVKVDSSGEEDEFDAWNLIPMRESNSLPLEIPDEHTVEINDACTETSSSDMSEGLPAESSFENRGNRMFEPPKAPPGFELWQHTKSKILHLTDYRFPNVFECGRKPGAFHTNQGVNPRWDTGICWRCFKHK